MSRSISNVATFYSLRNRVSLVHGGEAFFQSTRTLIREATQTLHLQTYIFEDDETGRMIAGDLVDAAMRGVNVCLLLDGYASRDLSDDWVSRLQAAGVQFRFFEPLLRSSHFYFGRRLHHKVTVADRRRALVGGINISNRYNDLPGQPAWLDWAVSVEGEVADELYGICLEYWYRSTKTAKMVMQSASRTIFPADWDCAVQVRRNDWVRRFNQISRSYIGMFREAKKEIHMMSSYFLPGRVMRRNMEKASKRGVAITLLLAGRSDVPIAKYAERYIYRWMLQTGIRIFEYHSTILHAKLATYDDLWVTTGSYNVNNISAYASIELNLDVRDDDFAREVRMIIKGIIDQEGREVTMNDLQRYSWFQRLLQLGAYEIYRLVFYLFTFYFRQEDRAVK